jgi:hypothetical protein
LEITLILRSPPEAGVSKDEGRNKLPSFETALRASPG